MGINRLSFRVVAGLILIALTISQVATPADAHARLIAVIILRSTASADKMAIAASKALAARLSQEPGWNAVAVDPHGRTAADAAAAIGAEVYVVGQYFSGDHPHVVGASYSVATDERMRNFSFDLAFPNRIPSSISFASVVSESDSNQVAVAAPTPQPTANEQVVVPRGTVIVVAMDHQLNSYSAASREPLSYTVAQDVVIDGHIVAKAGDEATGLVLEAQQGSKGGPYGIGWRAANLRIDVEAVHSFCGDTIPMEFIRSEYRRRQGLFGSHQDLEIIKGQKYLAHVAHTMRACGEPTTEASLPPPQDVLAPDDSSPTPQPEPAKPTPLPGRALGTRGTAG